MNLPYSYRVLSCPECHRMIRLGFVRFGLIPVGSGLGPPLFQCTRCNAVFDSGLEEWAMMGIARKTRYVILSIAYALVLGFLFAFQAALIGGLIDDKEGRFYQQLESPTFWILLAVFALVVLLIQALRVHLSIDRTSMGIEPFQASYWSWQTNLQAWVIKMLILGVIVASLVSKIV